MRKIPACILFLTIILLSACKKGDEHKEMGEQLTTDIEGNLFMDPPLPSDPNYVGMTVECGDQIVSITSGNHFSFKGVKVNKDFAKITVRAGNKIVGTRIFQPHQKHTFLNLYFIIESFPGHAEFQNNAPFVYDPSFLHVSIPANSFQDQTIVYDGHLVISNGLGQTPAPKDMIPGNVLAKDENGKVMGLRFVSDAFYIGFTNQQGNEVSLLEGKQIKIKKVKSYLDPPTGPYFLFSLDKETGLWKKVSSATLNIEPNDNQFIAETPIVNHYFVFAKEFEVVEFTGKIIAPNQFPLFSKYMIYSTDDKLEGFLGYTNKDGEINGYIPKGKQITLELLPISLRVLYSQYDLLFKKQLGSFSINSNLGTVTGTAMGDTVAFAIVTYTGVLVDCNNNPLSNYIVRNTDFYSSFPDTKTNTNGEFVVNFTRPNMYHNNYFITLLDPATGKSTQQLHPIYLKKDLKSTRFDIDTVRLCNDNTEEYLRLKIDNQVYNLSPPTVTSHFRTFPGLPIEPFISVEEEITTNTGPLLLTSFYGNKNAGRKRGAHFSFNNLQISQWPNGAWHSISENRNTGSFYIKGEMEPTTVRYSDGSVHTISCEYRLKN